MADNTELLRSPASLAPATNCLALSKVFAHRNHGSPAIASAIPVGSFLRGVGIRHGDKASEAFSGDVLSSGDAVGTSGYCRLKRFTVSNSPAHKLMRNAKLSAPLKYGLCSSLISCHAIISAIVALFALCRPATIARFVVAIYVYSVNAHPFRGLKAHVVDKISKRLSPSIAYGNPATTVLSKLSCGRVSASLDHCDPRVVFARFNCSQKMPMLHYGFKPMAAATDRLAHPKIASANGSHDTARTLAIPRTLAAENCLAASNHRPATENATCQFNSTWHVSPVICPPKPCHYYRRLSH